MNTQSVHPQEYVVLGFLMTQQRHGYEIHRYFSSGLGSIWYAGRSQIYALLSRLEKTGQVTTSIEPQDLRPAKKIYTLTAKGRETFLGWMKEPVEKFRDLRLEFLTKVYFLKELGLPGFQTLIEKQMVVTQAQLQSLYQQQKDITDDFQRLALDFRISQILAVLAWLHKCLQECRPTSEKENPVDEEMSL